MFGSGELWQIRSVLGVKPRGVGGTAIYVPYRYVQLLRVFKQFTLF